MKCILTIVIENKKLWRQKEQLHLMIYSDIFFPPLISGTFNGYLFRNPYKCKIHQLSSNQI